VSPRLRVTLLLALLGAVAAGGGVLVRFGLKPTPVVVSAEPPRPPSTFPEAATSLSPPASTAPERVERATADAKRADQNVIGREDGVVTMLTITTPVFEINRRYRSMEGPHAEYALRVDTGSTTPLPASRELLWWKGARIEILDEAGKPLDQEFMCHLNIDVDPKARAGTLGTASTSRRILTLTQGEISFALAKGRGLPVASDETWSYMFQVLNHNRDGAFRVKQRLTLYFVRDVDAFAPIDPVDAYAASVWVPLDKPTDKTRAFDLETCHCCAPLGRGLEATNSLMGGHLVDDAGRTLVGHWVVPPGKSTWSYPIRSYVTPNDQERSLYATWTHVHPFATEVRLVAHKPGCAPKVVARSTVESLHDERIGLASIRSFASAEGETVPAGAALELAVDYDNTTGRAQDSMTSLGMHFGIEGWKRPAWASRAQKKDMDSCGVGPPK
jgi:hypothetical protein